ncbi:MAG: glucosaminidase domain-containing protein [Bacilli bacterium]|nr:glucosaminidase domain-containing protein [Bacilli bacterium]
MKRKIILIILVFLFNMIWVNAITATNNFVNHNNLIIKIKQKTNLNNTGIMDDLDVMLDNNLSYEDVDAITIGNKINNNLKGELSGYGELIAKYSIVNEVNPYLVSAMIIENSDCDEVCSVLVTKCNNVGKLLYHKDSLTESSCFGGNYQNFSSIDSSIKAYIKYIKTNFYDKELTTPGAIYKIYNKDVRWVFKVNNLIDQIKNS